MSTDSFLRAIGAISCVYAFGFLVTVTSTAALNAAVLKPSAICGAQDCTIASHHHATPSAAADDFAYSRAIHTAALFLAGE
jgi:hypothetical protein